MDFTPNRMAMQLGDDFIHAMKLYEIAGYEVMVIMDMNFDKKDNTFTI